MAYELSPQQVTPPALNTAQVAELPVAIHTAVVIPETTVGLFCCTLFPMPSSPCCEHIHDGGQQQQQCGSSAPNRTNHH